MFLFTFLSEYICLYLNKSKESFKKNKIFLLSTQASSVLLTTKLDLFISKQNFCNLVIHVM